MKVNVLMFNQDDPKKCTAAKLLRFGLVKKITKTSPTTLLLHPYAKNTLLSSDKNVVRSITGIDCSWNYADDVFEKKDEIANAVKGELNDAMVNYGYDIIKALVTDIDPDAEVKTAMNRINAAERQKIAAQYDGDAARILIVEKAKAEAESKRLQGQGIADQRREIARGLEESVDVLNNVGINSQEASALIVVTQHYDTLQSIGEETNSNLILLPNSPQAGSDMLNNMVASFSASNQIGEAMKKENQKKVDDKGDSKD